MKAVLALTLVVLALAACTQTNVPPDVTPPTPPDVTPPDVTPTIPADVTSITTGFAGGYCSGYCHQFITIEGTTVTYTDRSTNEDEPDIVYVTMITQALWDDLISSLDIDDFNTLPDRPEWPDCKGEYEPCARDGPELADSASEYITIGDKTLSLYPSDGVSVPKIDSFLNRLRAIRMAAFGYAKLQSCADMQEPQRQSCIINAAARAQDLDMCLTRISNHDLCYHNLAIATQDPSLCTNINDASLQEACESSSQRS